MEGARKVCIRAESLSIICYNVSFICNLLDQWYVDPVYQFKSLWHEWLGGGSDFWLSSNFWSAVRWSCYILTNLPLGIGVYRKVNREHTSVQMKWCLQKLIDFKTGIASVARSNTFNARSPWPDNFPHRLGTKLTMKLFLPTCCSDL